MVAEKRPCSAIRMRNNLLCNNDVFQNAVRGAHRRMNSEQARALRDAAAKSGVWSSAIHLTDNNVFSEAFFVNAVVVAKRVDLDIVYVDDTACVNAFMLPVVVMLARDASNNTHSIAWGILRDRTVEAFEGFFRFVARFFPLKTFMCDRCPAQSLALKRAFGAEATVLNCAVHIGRNIKQNAGHNSELRSRFWAMRQQRTAEAEESFVASLRKLHATRRSNFTTSLLNAIDAFLPSKTDPFLKCPVFPSVHRLKSVDLSAFTPTTPTGLRAKQTLVELQSVADVFEDVFSRDNTNSIEGYFGIIKRRLKKNTSTVLDLFNAVDFTEASALARSDPARPRVPPDLARCILRVLSPSVFVTLSKRGVDELLSLLVRVSLGILVGLCPSSECGLALRHSLDSGLAIDTRSWMPETWTIPTETARPVHEVKRATFSCATSDLNVMMRMDPFLSCANRSVAVYDTLNNALVSLCTLTGKALRRRDVPFCYTHLREQFTHFAEMVDRDADVSRILLETCHTLEAIPRRSGGDTRKSIVDPGALRLIGPRTTTTSARVDHRTACPGAKMVRDFLEQTKPTRTEAVKRTHHCAVCLREGHHARTCKDMLLEENSGRLSVFFEKMIKAGGLKGFVRSLMARRDKAYSRAVIQRLNKHSHMDIEDLL